MDRNAVVWVPQEATNRRRKDGTTYNINILPATQFGSLEFVFEPHHIIINGDAAWQQVCEAMSDYQSHQDYILSLGDPAGIAMLCAYAGLHGRVRLLKWDRQERVYYPVEWRALLPN